LMGSLLILAWGLNFTWGMGGLFNLGIVGTMSIGAYTHVLLQKNFHLPFLVTLASGVITALLIGWGIAMLTRRIRKDEFQVFTLAFLYAVYSLTLGWDSLTRGPLGFPGILRPTFARTDAAYCVLVMAFVGATWILLRRLALSPFGRLLEASRDDERAVMTLGKDPLMAKVKAFVVASALSGLAGGLVASQLRYIDPGTFYLSFTLFSIVMVAVGGFASLPGTVLGAGIVFVVTNALRFAPFPPQFLGPLRMIFFALVLLTVVLVKPKGIMGRVEVE